MVEIRSQIFVANSILPKVRTGLGVNSLLKMWVKSQLLDAGKNWWDSIVIGDSDSTSRKPIRVPDMRQLIFSGY